jgi:hypothetical protein
MTAHDRTRLNGRLLFRRCAPPFNGVDATPLDIVLKSGGLRARYQALRATSNGVDATPSLEEARCARRKKKTAENQVFLRYLRAASRPVPGAALSARGFAPPFNGVETTPSDNVRSASCGKPANRLIPKESCTQGTSGYQM